VNVFAARLRPSDERNRLVRSKNQQTWLKKEREQRVKAKRALKAERKQEKKAAAAAALVAAGEAPTAEATGAEAPEIEAADHVTADD
jgi:hypothetical protein